MNRRSFLRSTAATASLFPLTGFSEEKAKFQIGACDWTLGKRGTPESLHVAKQLGLAGVQASFDQPGVGTDLRTKAGRELFAAAEAEHGTKVGSLGMGVLNKIPYKSEPETEAWVSESIDAAKAMGLTVVLLAFFGKNNLKDDAAGTAEVIKRLKKVAPKAEANGVILGLETTLDVKEHLHILDAVDSPSVQVYYDVGNSLHYGYDIYSEIRELGKERICEMHAKDYARKTFGEGDVDFEKVKASLGAIGWEGWIHIESRRKSYDLEGFQADADYLKSVFGS